MEFLKNLSLETLIGGTLIGSLSTFIISYINSRITKNKTDSEIKKTDNDIKKDNFQLIVDNYDKDNKRLREEISELRERSDKNDEKCDSLESKYISLKSRFELMNSTHLNLPIPQWLKDQNGIMLSLNDEYEINFLVPAGMKKEDYVGKDDIEVWGEKIGKEYRKNDEIVRIRDKAVIFRETVMFDEHDVSSDWIFMKYPLYVNNIFIGIAGIAFPLKYIEEI